MPVSILRGRPWPRAGEPLWTDDDIDSAVAYEWAMREVCPECGTRDSEWRDADGMELDPPPYVVEGHRCVGCADLERERKDPQYQHPGVRLVLRRFDPARDAVESDDE